MLIYKVTNLINGKVYIGQTSLTLEQRKSRHEHDAVRLNRKTVSFHNSLKKYGFENFKWEILQKCETQEELDKAEIENIKKFNSMDKSKGYNLKAGGKLGGAYNEEVKANIGKSTKKKWENPEIASRMREGLKKATEKWQKVCEEKRVVFKCPICGKEEMRTNWEIKKYKYCSIECANKGEANNRVEMFKLATEKNKENYDKEKQVRLKKLKEWLNNKDHQNEIINCKMNKLTFLTDLCNFIGVKDHRTLAKILEVTNKKDTVNKLRELVKMYAEQSDN
jgi:predicted RNA-binding Zn-ribbon protein involved in translation (DUF1610 family)